MRGLITGAGQGLGLELVRQGLSRGHIMIAACRKLDRPMPQLAVLKEQYKDRLYITEMDVTSEQQVSRAADQVKKTLEQLDYVVNNAGVLYESNTPPEDAAVDLDIGKYRRTIEVNAVGPAIVLKYFLPLIYPSPDACVINITSEAGHMDAEGYSYLAYGVSKYAANMYTQKIRNYLVQTGKHVRIFMVHPGRMDTVMGRENAQIPAAESAEGIFRIIEKETDPVMEIPFINYKGEAMPY